MDKLEQLTENIVDGISDEQYGILKSSYSDKMLIMTSNEQINFNGPVKQDNSRMGKPNGLWYGVGTSWIDWVKSSVPGWIQKHVFEITPEYSNILKIQNFDELVEFSNEYSYRLQDDISFKVIDWIKVAEKYDGIEITNYMYKTRMNFDYFWYWGWDVASGCIWNKSAISDIKRIF